MKLSKKGAAIQRAIHDALASGKALGGLLVGFAATVAGCGERHSSAHTMGRFPDPSYQENAKNEDANVFVTEGEIPDQKKLQRKNRNLRKRTQFARCKVRGPLFEASRCLFRASR